MPRKKRDSVAKMIGEAEPNAQAVAVAEPATPEPKQPPAWIDGPPTPLAGDQSPEAKSEVRQWGNPYRPIFVSKDKGFEMGENKRFRQRVFLFNEKPDEQVLAALKDNGFTYRASEKAWTIHADADTRRLSDELAREFAGQAASMSR